MYQSTQLSYQQQQSLHGLHPSQQHPSHLRRASSPGNDSLGLGLGLGVVQSPEASGFISTLSSQPDDSLGGDAYITPNALSPSFQPQRASPGGYQQGLMASPGGGSSRSPLMSGMGTGVGVVGIGSGGGMDNSGLFQNDGLTAGGMMGSGSLMHGGSMGGMGGGVIGSLSLSSDAFPSDDPSLMGIDLRATSPDGMSPPWNSMGVGRGDATMMTQQQILQQQDRQHQLARDQAIKYQQQLQHQQEQHQHQQYQMLQQQHQPQHQIYSPQHQQQQSLQHTSMPPPSSLPDKRGRSYQKHPQGPPSNSSGAPRSDHSPAASKRKRAPSALAIASQESEAALRSESRGTTSVILGGAVGRRKSVVGLASPNMTNHLGERQGRRASETELGFRVKQETDLGGGGGGGAGGGRDFDDHKPSSATSYRMRDTGGPHSHAHDDDVSGNNSGSDDDGSDGDDNQDDGDGVGRSGGDGSQEDPSAANSDPGGNDSSTTGGGDRKSKSRRLARSRAGGGGGASSEHDPATLKEIRLARKAELARLSRKQKKDRLQELEQENAQLRAKIQRLEVAAAAAASSSSNNHAGVTSPNSGASSKKGHKDKKMKAEGGQNSGMTPPPLQHQQSIGGDSPTLSISSSQVLSPSVGQQQQVASSSQHNHIVAPMPTAVSVSPQQQAEALQHELNATCLGLTSLLNRNDMLRPGVLGVQPGSAASQRALHIMPAPDVELGSLISRLLELHNSRCLLSAEMSHAFESMLYADVRAPGANGGSSGPSSERPGLLPLHFLQWLLCQPQSFYSDPAGLWRSLWEHECGASPDQVTAMLEVKVAAGSSNDQDAPLSLDAFERGHQQQHLRVASHGASNSMMDTSGQATALITTTHMMDQSPSTSGLGSDASLHHNALSSTAMVPSIPPRLTPQGFNRVHTSLLTSFEHFRSLLISHQQSELSILNQLMQILTPLQFAKFCKFAITFGPVVMNQFATRA